MTGFLRERVLAIVSLIAQYIMDDHEPISNEDIVQELLDEGFDSDEIDAAFNWMENISLHLRKASHDGLQLPTNRIFTVEESHCLSPEAQGFLVRLRGMGILDDDLQEEIIDKALQMEEEDLSLKDIKTITALTLFSSSQRDWHREINCIFEDDWSRLYH